MGVECKFDDFIGAALWRNIVLIHVSIHLSKKRYFAHEFEHTLGVDDYIFRANNTEFLLGVSLLPLDAGFAKLRNHLPQFLLSEIRVFLSADQYFLFKRVDARLVVNLGRGKSTFLN